ncbi:MAG TPA: hypothetical protein VFZ54_20530 [Burkholderiales bacterium]
MKKSGSVSVAANGTSGNVLAGSVIEFPERPSRIKAFATAAAVGVVGDLKAGARTVMEESVISQANRFPLDPDDLMVQDAALAGQRLSLTFRNTTGAAIIVYWSMSSDPVA